MSKPADHDQIEILDPVLRGGFAQVPRVVLKAKGLSDRAKVVYALLLDYAWQQGSCFPGQRRLADDLATTERTIRTALNDLKAYGLISWKRRGLSQTNVYSILSLAENPRLGSAATGFEADRKNSSGQERKKIAGQDRKKISAKRDSELLDPEINISKLRRASPEKRGLDDEPKTHARASTEAGDEPEAPTRTEIHLRPKTAALEDPSVSHTTPTGREEPPENSTASPGYERLREVASKLRAELKDNEAGKRRGASKPTAIGELLPAQPAAISEMTPVEPVPTMPPVTDEALPRRRGRPPGSREDREHLAAYLADFARELGDQAPLSSTITRALRLFQQANVAPPLWGDFLYRARSITQEHSGQIKAKPAGPDTSLSFAPKPKVGYFFAVLTDLLGLKDDPDSPSAASRAGFANEDKSHPTARLTQPARRSDRFGYAP